MSSDKPQTGPIAPLWDFADKLITQQHQDNAETRKVFQEGFQRIEASVDGMRSTMIWTQAGVTVAVIGIVIAALFGGSFVLDGSGVVFTSGQLDQNQQEAQPADGRSDAPETTEGS